MVRKRFEHMAPYISNGMRAFAEKHNLSLGDPNLRGLYEYELSAIRDEKEFLRSARLEGLEEGVQMGRLEGRREGLSEGRLEERMTIIRALLSNEVPLEVIYNTINAPRVEIDKMIESLRA